MGEKAREKFSKYIHRLYLISREKNISALIGLSILQAAADNDAQKMLMANYL